MVAFQLLWSKHLTGGTYLDSVSEGVIHPSTKGVVAQATDTVVMGAHSVPDQDLEKALKPESRCKLQRSTLSKLGFTSSESHSLLTHHYPHENPKHEPVGGISAQPPSEP